MKYEGFVTEIEDDCIIATAYPVDNIFHAFVISFLMKDVKKCDRKFVKLGNIFQCEVNDSNISDISFKRDVPVGKVYVREVSEHTKELAKGINWK